jgi:nicotinic acid mononucleotide adenylyltransferase
MNIGVFPGSFKPPHKGHFQLIQDAIKKDKLQKVVIIISKYPRYLDDKIQNAKDYSKEELNKHFGKLFATKSEALTYIQSIKSKSPSINPITSKKIWELYLSKIKVSYEVKIGFFFSPMINSNVYLKKELKKDKQNKYFLYKSSKDEQNSRFDFIQQKYKKNIVIQIKKLKYNISARDFRNDILLHKDISKYLPKLDDLQKKEVIQLLQK